MRVHLSQQLHNLLPVPEGLLVVELPVYKEAYSKS